MRNKVIFLIISLIFAAIFFGMRYARLLQDKVKIERQLAETRREVGFLEGRLREEKELRQQLSREKELLASSLKDAEETIAQLNEKNAQAQEHIFSLVKEVNVLDDRNAMVREELTQLKEELNALEAENTQLETRLHSIPELKKAIKEVKLQMRNLRVKPKAASRRPEIKKDGEYRYFSAESIDGNSGFIVKDGIPTYKTRVKIEVKPLL